MSKTIYMLQNVSAGCVGDSPLFWKEGGCGYTINVNHAQRFTPEEAASIIRSTRGSHSWKRWKVGDVLKASFLVCDIQKLRESKKRKVSQ